MVFWQFWQWGWEREWERGWEREWGDEGVLLVCGCVSDGLCGCCQWADVGFVDQGEFKQVGVGVEEASG